jgi:hypothetical protein
MRNIFRIIFGKLEEKRLFGRPRRRWRENIDFKVVRCDCVDLIFLPLGPVAYTCKHGNEPFVSIKGRKCPDQLNDY